MLHDINRKKVTKNAFRITKTRGETALRIRVPGGHINADILGKVQALAEKFGNGTVHITTRQGFEIPGIPYERMAEVNADLEEIIRKVELPIGVDIPDTSEGYPSAGTRNVAACIGNRVCPFANYDTTALAEKIESQIYPHNLHVKKALTGCPNDCIKAHMQDFGIIGIAQPQYDSHYCIGCEACVKNCKKKVTGALTMENGKVVRDARRCIGCGECVMVCPTTAWTRNPQKFFRLIIMGRTGKKNPRIASTFLDWATEEVILHVIAKTYEYTDKYIDRSLAKEHVGYIVDRTGYPEFKRFVLDGIELNPEARVAKQIQWAGYKYVADIHMTDQN